MQCPKAALFDLDDTLAESFQPPSASIIGRLERVLALMPVAILSAASYERIHDQIAAAFSSATRKDRFYMLPNSSAQCFVYADNNWQRAYDFTLTTEDRAMITGAIEDAVKILNITDSDSPYPYRIIDRGVQVAFAALGLDAPREAKAAWDPLQEKRKRLKAELEKRIPQFDVLIGGMTTIDVTAKGVDKAYGVRWLAQRLSLETSEMLFVGDALYEGGNDNVVIPTGILTRSVLGPAETGLVIDELLQSCQAAS